MYGCDFTNLSKFIKLSKKIMKRLIAMINPWKGVPHGGLSYILNICIILKFPCHFVMRVTIFYLFALTNNLSQRRVACLYVCGP